MGNVFCEARAWESWVVHGFVCGMGCRIGLAVGVGWKMEMMPSNAGIPRWYWFSDDRRACRDCSS